MFTRGENCPSGSWLCAGQQLLDGCLPFVVLDRETQISHFAHLSGPCQRVQTPGGAHQKRVLGVYVVYVLGLYFVRTTCDFGAVHVGKSEGKREMPREPSVLLNPGCS